jgi:S-adenosylmethionine hydrolase
MTPPIILLTDFGTLDGYVASMKGVILTIAPTAPLIDLTHDVAPQNIDQAAFLLWASYKNFPRRSIFVCVVDPGVGSRRAILAAQIAGYRFLAPDNGLLKYVLSDAGADRIVAVSNRKYFRKEISRTFHGRDIFAPIAAHLANGVSLTSIGSPVEPLTTPESFVRVRPSTRSRTYAGAIVHIDHFGNAVTNFRVDGTLRGRILLRVGGRLIRTVHRTYSEAHDGMAFAIIGSAGLLEISMREASAAALLRLKLRQSCTLRV